MKVVEYSLIVDTEDCVGCHACEVACKQEHDLPAGPGWIRVSADDPREIDGRPRLRYRELHCMHCKYPPCQDICKMGAITKRDDGIVLIDEELCTGCKDCVAGCPLGVMKFDEVKGLAGKCDLCVDRLDRGLQPVCLIACPGHCIYSGDIREIVETLREKRLSARQEAETTEPGE